MTPLAAQMFRHGSENDRRMLAGCQFFECTKIMDMAQEMGKADVEAGCDVYSEMAQLPAPMSAFEYVVPGGERVLLVAEQHEEEIRLWYFLNIQPGSPKCRFATGFVIGSNANTEIQWFNYPGEPARNSMSQPEIAAARAINLLLEKSLCIINQPGLVQRVERPADKRVIKLAKEVDRKADVSRFYECRIVQGRHGGEATGEGQEMPLHYVRKHWRPSASKWVDGYWRGNAALGLHLKWYSPQSPAGGRD